MGYSAAFMPPSCSVIQEAVLRRLAALGLAPASSILDAPCGAGALTSALLAQGHDVLGADLAPEAMAVLGERFHPADLNGPLPWSDASFDVLCSVEGIEHLESPFAFLREARRVLKPGGILVATTPNTVSLRSRVRFFGSGFYHRDPSPLNESERHPLHHIGLRTFPELRYMLHTSGFRLRTVGHTHIKPVSFLYLGLAPWMAIYTLVAFRKEKDEAQRRRNRDVRRALFSRSLLLGENLLLEAVRE